jgi:ATP-dependent Lhr-like helicase
VLLETYRECLRDFFDMPALVSTLADVRSRRLRVSTVDTETPSPFAASLLFTYVASFIYDGDAPLAERRAQALAVDQAQLRELLGDAELRELLDAGALDAVERQLQRLDPQYHVRSADGVHDMLLSLGDLAEAEIRERAATPEVVSSVTELVAARRAVPVRIAGTSRLIAGEDAARFRDALGVPLPVGIPEALLQPVRDPIGDIALRYARTHAPFTAGEFAARYGLGTAAAEAVLGRLTAEGRIVEGEFRPGGTRREWTDAGVLRMLRRRSLAKLRHEVEPVDQSVLGRFATTWQGIVKRRSGADALLDAIEQLQGAPLPASILETEILAARIDAYDPAELDVVTAAGEVVWVGVESLGERDGRIALYLSDHLPRLLPPAIEGSDRREISGRERAILDALQSRGASFFAPLHEAVGGGYPAETIDALWSLVWHGLVTNDTFHALRAFSRARPSRSRPIVRRDQATAFRSRRLVPPSAEGRWALVPRRAIDAGRGSAGAAAARARAPQPSNATKWAAATAQQLLARHGIVTREALNTESIPGGFGIVYPVLKGMEDAGRVRRGYFVAGLGATQFAMPGALDLLRSLRDVPEEPEVVVLPATDPANPYGAALKWSGSKDARRGPTRSVGATVMLVNGALAAYLARGDRQLLTYLPDAEPDRSKVARAVARALIDRARTGGDAPRGMLIEEIDGAPPNDHPLTASLVRTGFIKTALGLQATIRSRQSLAARRQSQTQVGESQSPVDESSPVEFPSPDGSESHIVDEQRNGRPGAAPARSRPLVSSPFSRRYFDQPKTPTDD